LASYLVILASSDLLNLIFDVEVAKVASPNGRSDIHGFFAFIKIVEKKNVQCQNASDGDEIPDQVLSHHEFAVLSELSG